MAENDNQGLAKQISELEKQHAVLEEKMSTAFERLRADMANWKTDMANWKTDMVKRDKSNMQWMVGFVLGSAVLVIAVLGLLLTSTPSP